MSKGGDQVQETPAQLALAQYAQDQMADYKKRWLPVQQRLAAQIQDIGKPDSAARRAATGRASTDTAIQFTQAAGALEKALAKTGVGVGSSRGKLAMTGLGTDEARSRGLGMTVADQQVEDAYTKGLTALMQQGRGEKATVTSSLGSQAQMSAQQARADAAMALQERMGTAELVGTVGGYGLQQALKPNVPGATFGTVPGGYTAPGETTRYNNPSAYVPPVDTFVTNPQAGY